MNTLFAILGMIGIGLSAVAYLPQLTHLAKEHCSAGVSVKAWTLWMTSSLLVGSLAVHRGDYVLICLAATSLLSSIAILALALRYRTMVCATHIPALSSAATATGTVDDEGASQTGGPHDRNGPTSMTHLESKQLAHPR